MKNGRFVFLLIVLVLLIIFTFGIFFRKNIIEKISNKSEPEKNLVNDLVENNSVQNENDSQKQNKKVEEELSFEEIIWNKRVSSAFKNTTCSPPKPHNASYSGKIIDTHFHIESIPDSEPEDEEDYEDVSERPVILGIDTTMDEIVCLFEYEGTEKALSFFPVYPEIYEHALLVVNKTMERYPNNFYPFIMPPDHDDDSNGFPTVDAGTLEEMLNVYPNLFKGYGEIGLYSRGGNGEPKGAPELPPDSQRLQAIYPIIRENNLVIYFHLGEGQKDNFERVLKANPDINFIWHGDQLIYSDENRQNLEDIDDILDKYPNAYYGIDELYGDVWLLNDRTTKEEFLKHFKNYEPLLEKDTVTWKGFIEDHPDQVLWGTDRGVTFWTLDKEVGWVLNDYARAFIGKLKPDVQEKFAYKNAEKLIYLE